MTSGVKPQRARLDRYQQSLLSVGVDVGGVAIPFLFDTGAGLTCLTPATVEALGCRPTGRLTGFRKSGERIDGPRCEAVRLVLDGSMEVEAECLMLDLAALLPADWPRVGGAVSLNAFEGRSIRIRHGEELRVASSAAALQEGGTWRRGRSRIARQAGGASLGLFVAVQGPASRLWFALDTGNTGPTLIAPHALPLLGLEPASGPWTAALTFEGIGALELQVAVHEMIYDGLIGLPAIGTWDVVLDLAANGFWLRR